MISRYTYEQVKAEIDHGYMPDFGWSSHPFYIPALCGQALTLIHTASWFNALWIGTRFA